LKFLLQESTHFSQSSSFNRGAWTFTSLISNHEKFIFLDDHLERLTRGATFLYPHSDFSILHSELRSFLFKHFKANCYFRINLIDDVITVEIKPHAPKSSLVKLTRAQYKKTLSMIPSYLKVPNYLFSDLELKNAQEQNYDDVLFFDESDTVQELSTSNIFLISRDKKILTPPTSAMVLEGVVRKNLIKFAQTKGYFIEVRKISEKALLEADEVIITNSVQGLRRVTDYRQEKKYTLDLNYTNFCQEFGRFGECFCD